MIAGVRPRASTPGPEVFNRGRRHELFPPEVAIERGIVEIGREIALGDLLTYSDLDNNPVQRWRVRDNGTEAFSGFFTVDGTRQGAGGWFEFGAGLLSSVFYQAGLIVDTESFNVQAFDGEFWGAVSSNLMDTIPRNFSPPEVVGNPSSVLAQEMILASDLFIASDPDGNTLKKFGVYDTGAGGGNFKHSGTELAAGQWHIFDYPEVANIDYHTPGDRFVQPAFQSLHSENAPPYGFGHAGIFLRNTRFEAYDRSEPAIMTLSGAGCRSLHKTESCLAGCDCALIGKTTRHALYQDQTIDSLCQ